MKAVATVLYSDMRHRGEFVAAFPGLVRGDLCVIRSERGIDLGHVISEPVEAADDATIASVGEILRKATPDDVSRQQPMGVKGQSEAFRFCAEKIVVHDLPMKLVGVEHVFGGGKIVFYYLSDARVDFRGLVRDLAQKLHARIEMKQIGVRDEAKLLGTVNSCGRELCCRSFLKTFAPVTMKMAKNQKSTLDPSKISGRCGRLMCCLRYEDDTYSDLKRELPRRGCGVCTSCGNGKVVDHEVLKQNVIVELENGTRVSVPLRDVQVIEK